MIKYMQDTQVLIPIGDIVQMNPRTKSIPERVQSIDNAERNLGTWQGIGTKHFQLAPHGLDTIQNRLDETYPTSWFNS